MESGQMLDAVLCLFDQPNLVSHMPVWNKKVPFPDVSECQAECPADFPYAYRPANNFDYCCATADDVAGNVGINSGPRDQRSGSCEGHKYKKCDHPPCADYAGPSPKCDDDVFSSADQQKCCTDAWAAKGTDTDCKEGCQEGWFGWTECLDGSFVGGWLG